ncbi:hypothetical protein KEJ25_07785 [Candidatus Bathyarchaeota archaeon]|nr:hypothetical protein [Candidatus Bathyarchaeota archaeon]
MKILGHRKIENTMVYITVENNLFQTSSDEFRFKTASTIEEAGFEYVTTFNNTMLFRKRK